MNNVKKKIDASFLLLALIAVLLGGGVVLAIDSFRFDPIERSIAGDGVINTLFVIEKDGRPFSSYVLILYPATGRAAVFDVPANLGSLIPRINRVDRIASVYDPPRLGHYTAELERLLGIDIPFSFAIPIENLGRLTDLLRGVEVFIPSPVNVYYYGHILFPSGRTVLDGAKAQIFATYQLEGEHPEIVSGRRQQFFMSFIRRIGEQYATLQHPRMSRLFHAQFSGSASTRMRVRLFNELAQIDVDRSSIQAVRGILTEVSGQELLFPHANGTLIREVVRHTIGNLLRSNDDLMVDRVFTVEVLNGTTTVGLAARTAELISDFGFDVISVGNADRNDHGRTLIIDRSGHRQMAVAFGDIIRSRNIHFYSPYNPHGFEFNNFSRHSDFILILGSDFDGRFVAD